MAKVSELKYEIRGISYKTNINCDSSGNFNMNLPKEVAESLRINEKLTAKTLIELTNVFNKTLEHYKTVETVETLHILIAYQARGKYTYRSDGSVLFGNMDKLHKIDVSFSEIDNALGLDFFVAIKQVIDGKEEWFRAKLGKDCSWVQEKEYAQPDIYHKMKSVSTHRIERYKIIPFNEDALNTLKMAEEKLRMISEMLFNFIKQDEEQILLTLTNTNQKLLN